MKILGTSPARTTEASAPADPRMEAAPARPIAQPRTDSVVSEALKDLEQKPYFLASRASRKEDTLVSVGGLSLGGLKPIIFAGPGLIRDEAQLHACPNARRQRPGRCWP